MDDALEAWQAGLPEELKFWDRWLGGRTKYNDDRELRLTPDREIPWWMAEKLDPAVETPRVLDVGAGPLTALGTRWGERKVDLIAVDPLANGYNDILDHYALQAPVATRFGLGEELSVQFGEGTFDFAYACNCLDHAQNPVECYRQMLAVLKPGAWLMTWHEAEEAVHQNWEGMHQWNFIVRNGRLKTYNRIAQFDVVDLCAEAGEFFLETDRKYIKFGMRKRREGEASATVQAPPMESLATPMVSLHIPKTAGTSFRFTLEDWFGEGLLPIYPPWPESLFTQNFTEKEQAADCLHGHFPVDRLRGLTPKRPFITWLRDPVQRVVSSYFQVLRHPDRENTKGFDGQVIDERWSLQRYANNKWIQRQLFDYLRGWALEDFAFVGIAEEYELSLAVLARLLGREVPDSTSLAVNSNPGKATPDYALSPALKAELEGLYQNDIILWHQARGRLHAQAKALGVLPARSASLAS